MHVCMYVCMYVCVGGHLEELASRYLCIHACMIFVCVLKASEACVEELMHVCIIHICVCVWIYIYIYIYIYM